MNLNNNPTKEQLSELLNRHDDTTGHHIVWVTKFGDVHVSRLPDNMTPIGFEESQTDMQMRVETLQVDKGYVGRKAAKDDVWVSELYEVIMTQWPGAKGKSEVQYI